MIVTADSHGAGGAFLTAVDRGAAANPVNFKGIGAVGIGIRGGGVAAKDAKHVFFRDHNRFCCFPHCKGHTARFMLKVCPADGRAVDRAVIDSLRPIGAVTAGDRKGVSTICNGENTILCCVHAKTSALITVNDRTIVSHRVSTGIVIHAIGQCAAAHRSGKLTALCIHRTVRRNFTIVESEGRILQHTIDKAGFFISQAAGIGHSGR